ncbi:MAG: hypothetical protein ACLGJD_10860 [Gammaproteobacteria bacterium]|jgi:hypothetical protein|uniref:hypothetical protein n=1 Tax=uncultured Pseudacidovorax sp. TaxID=679313 RepID=UPI0025EC4A77|nr:hypothetical protein [uncultured Pseudacidovorax sp.]
MQSPPSSPPDAEGPTPVSNGHQHRPLIDLTRPDAASTYRSMQTDLGTIVQEGLRVTIDARDGKARHIIEVDPDRPCTAWTIKAAQRVIVDDISALTKHLINRIHQTTSHVLEFAGGGTFTCVYDHEGRMIETHAINMRTAVQADGVVILYGTRMP